jgi:hypothetical protein
MTSFYLKNFNIYYCRAGGIAEAVGLILMEWSDVILPFFCGDRDLKAKKVANWIGSGTTKPCSVKPSTWKKS